MGGRAAGGTPVSVNGACGSVRSELGSGAGVGARGASVGLGAGVAGCGGSPAAGIVVVVCGVPCVEVEGGGAFGSAGAGGTA